ncbi:hypothetical protein EST38_g4247 [Candolleomyces aberdarensis]|uniref:Uncharacterized protein n=1 Tax=Candolleomyces aberdarensis TaxID=2316362 RepID=A0A4Q2DQZ3_9AGAR|nr:hypothetical protein EST38_g4247 [Candolleomyces aberdarensis]
MSHERHQIFVVARVCIAPGKPRQYRCIAALHHHYCSDELPLRGVNSFKRLARVPENAVLINEELATYHERKEELPQRPCPYTSLLAESAFTVDLAMNPPYSSSMMWNLDADMGSSDGANNDGITILDVTVPMNPSYCFVFLGEPEIEDDVPGMIPLTAAQYLRFYCPVPEGPLDVNKMHYERCYLEAIANLDDMPLIPIATLAKVWPCEYVVANDELRDSDASGLEIDTGTTAQLITYPTEIDTFRRQAVLSSEDITRLKKALKGAMHPDAVVDLSRFPLTADQILSVLEELRDFKRLDVSHSQAVDSRVFLHILKTYKCLRWINILHCPISRDDLKELMTNDRQRFRSVETILHPAFLTGKLPADFPKAFLVTYITSFRPYKNVTLPFFSTDQLVQNIFDILSNIHDDSSHISMPSLTIVASSHLAQGQNWSDRAIQLVPGRNLDDDSDSHYYLHQKEVYQLVVQVDFCGKAYRILTPLAPEQSEHTDSDVIGMDSFLKRLEEEGSPATDAAGVKRLLELCANTQLISIDRVLRKRKY